MEFKDFLPALGIALGWLLGEGSALGKRAVDRKRTLGKAVSLLYFLCLEMVQLKMAQEFNKNSTTDIKEWERTRRRSFEEYAEKNPDFLKSLMSTAEAVGEYYPIEAYHLREVVSKYEFIKSKSLERFVENETLYVAMLSSYEVGFLAYQYKLEKILRFLAFRQSKITWVRIRLHFWKMRRNVSPGDIIFFQQTRRKRGRKSVTPPVAHEESAKNPGA